MPLNKWLNSRDVIWQSGTEVPKGQALLARKKAKTGSFHFVQCWTETLLLRLRTCNDPNGGWVKNGDRPHFPAGCAEQRKMGSVPIFRYFSRIAATPIPPAVQIEISPRPEPRSASCFASPATMRAPVAPNGWPTATLPPFGFIFARLIAPKGCVRLRRVRQYSSDSQAFRVQSTCAAKASWIS